MRRLSLILLGLVTGAGIARAEYGAGWQGGYNYPYPPQPTPIQIFNDSVFELQRRRLPVYTHEGRFLETPPDFSEAQRNAWIQTCHAQESHYHKFKACYEALRDQYERERANPYR